MAWYRQYRPQNVSDLHIAPVREQLQNVLDAGQFAHAYLFAGPKGTGKTSSARILARVLNDPRNQSVIQEGKGKFVEPDGKDPVLAKIAEGRSQVVIEQDAASHRGIDDVRQLQEHISVVPTEGFVRVVILDEVHMLTNEAFNALLKMLEEPPKNVVFVLATTELHKVPATVQSRCQLIRFRQATTDEIAGVLHTIAEAEEITLDDDIAARLAKVANGSFRDAVKYFEQIIRDGAVSPELAAAVLGSDEEVTDLLRALATKDVAAVSEYFTNARQKGVSFRALEQALLAALQERLSRAIQRQEAKKTLVNIVDLLEHFSQRLGGSEPVEGIALEVACYRWCVGEKSSNTDPDPNEAKSTPKSKTTTMACEKEDISREQAVPVAERIMTEQEVSPTQNTPKTASSSAVEASATQPLRKPVSKPAKEGPLHKEWPGILLAMREKSTAVESLLRNAEPGRLEGSAVHIALSLPFHKERLETTKYARAVKEVFEQRLGITDIEIVYDLLQRPDEAVVDVSAQAHDDLLVAAVEEALLSVET
ncbi:DNA polymerase III subunit gamma/tau [Candidatus Woesebacteria bacterium]|nr:DNA polymerase III subunit gamma/tau [Candidatus Woesebacteria bacterium]MCD8507615.1 DNA polymerase III subunit gamma/tau [Candidatus Woesebacteria bacterium]MCD8545981.1 DNA polymerase III subunit gamma/tau [Candidatus Woesebacteria bacterium]